MPYTIFVDGQEGTTGLKIHEYLSNIPDIEVLRIDPDMRKDDEARRELINEADIVFLCLPDEASRKAVAMIANPNTRMIDASTAFRTHPDWTYGLPELNRGQRAAIRASNRVAVPGCHATGFILAMQPLIAEGIVPADYPATCYALTGYSGGGKKLIAEYQGSDNEKLAAPRPYALGLNHKHLPEMRKYAGLRTEPLFTPIVGPYYQGDAVSIPLFPRLFNQPRSAQEIREVLDSYYEGERFVRVMPYESDNYLEDGFFPLMTCNDTNQLDLFVFGHGEQALLIARFDNLGKGAAGAAIQNMNIMLGLDESTGLE